MWSFDEKSYRKWLSAAAEAFNGSGVQPDLFERYALPLETESEADIGKALAETFGFWGKNKINPKLSPLLTFVIDKHRESSERLLEAVERRAARESAKQQRDKRKADRVRALKESIRFSCGAKGFLTPEEFRDLLTRYTKLGFTESDIRAHLGSILVREKAAEAAPAAQFREGLTAEIRQQIRQQLAILQIKDVFEFLGIAPGCTTEQWRYAYVVKDKEWRPRPADGRKAAANVLLGVVKAHLLASPEKYTDARDWEIAETLRPDVQAAAKDKLIPALTFESLVQSAVRNHGLDVPTARVIVQKLVDECGARVLPSESGDASIACINCGQTFSVKGAPSSCNKCGAPLWQQCPKCNNKLPSSVATCGICGLAVDKAIRAKSLFDEARREMQGGRIEGARQKSEEATRLWEPPDGELKDLIKAIDKRYEEVRTLVIELEADLSAHCLVAARRKLDSLRDKAKDVSLNDGEKPGDVIHAVDTNLRKAERLSREGDLRAKQRKWNEAAERFQQALDIANDYEPARKGLDTCPPEVPGDVTLRELSDAVEISWQPSPDRTAVEYVIRRREGSPPGPKDGQEIDISKGTSCRDTSPPAGVPLYYSVFARRGNAVSAGAATQPVLFAGGVRNAAIKTGDRLVSATWTPVIPGAQVKVTRREQGGAANVSVEAGPAGFEDRTVRNEVTYEYAVTVVYPGAGRNSTPVILRATPQAPLTPVDKLRIVPQSNGGYEISWDQPPRGEVRIYRLDRDPGFTAGTILSPPQASALGAPLPNKSPSTAVDGRPPDSVLYYLPVLNTPGAVLSGRASRFVAKADVTGFTVEDHGSKILLQWRWPEGCPQARVAWRSDSHPDDPEDQTQKFTDISRNGNDQQARITVDAADAAPRRFTIFAAWPSGDKTVFAPGLHPECRGDARTGAGYHLTYSLERGRGLFNRRRMKLHLVAETKDIPGIPEVVLVCKHGLEPPESLEDGDIVERIEHLYLPKRETVSHEFELGRTPSSLRLFFADHSKYRDYRVSHPPDTDLCFR